MPEIEAAKISVGLIGNIAASSALSTTLISMPVSSEICLFEFDQQGSPEQITDGLPFTSIGSGKAIADPFLGLIRRVFWGNGMCPSVNQAIFAAYWTLNHAIQINPGGVAGPIQIISLTKPNGEIEIKEYSDEELSEHEEAVRAAEKSLANFRDAMLTDSEAREIPKPQQKS